MKLTTPFLMGVVLRSDFVLHNVGYIGSKSTHLCEAAAVMWKDFDWKTPKITFQRHIEYIHRDRKNNPDMIVAGLKNKRHVRRRRGRYASRQESASKNHPFFSCSSRLMKELYLRAPDKEGLVFVNPETNSFFEYKCIQNKYDRAFQRAGLRYSGTHIVRYGGVNNAAEFTDDDKVLLDLLGNQRGYDYIRRKPDRLSALAEKMASGSN